MKILHLPLNVRGSEQIGQEKGLSSVFDEYIQLDYLKHEADFGKENTNSQLLQLIEGQKPDLIWAQIQETTTITPETWKTIREKYPNLWLTTWSGDAREYVPENLKQILPYFDIFYNDTNQGLMYEPYCKQYRFMPIAVDYDEATDFTHPTPHAPEIVFIGNNYGSQFSNGGFRLQLMEALTKEFGDRFAVLGNSWPGTTVNCIGNCEVKHQGAWYNQARVVISVDHVKGILHWSERLIWALASGTPVVVQNQPGLSDIFKDKLNYFDTIEGCIAEVRALLELPKQEIVSNMYYVKYNHTWEQRAQKIKEDYLNGNTLA